MHLLIATPIEPELVERVRAVSPEVTLSFESDLLPPSRYPADHQGDPTFRRTPVQEKRFANLLQDVDAIFGIPGETPAGLVAAVRGNPRLRWIQATTAGAGEIVRLAELTRKELERVTVTTTSGVHAAQLAEWACLGLLAFTKDVHRLLADQKARRWSRYPVRELRGQTLLVVGFGHIGVAVAERASAFGMRVVGVRRMNRPRNDAAHSAIAEIHSIDDLAALVPRADAVVLALPNTPETFQLFDRQLINQLSPHTVIVNVGRAATIDENALIEALRERRIGGAALDVYATEPLPADSELWDLPNVLLSPHTASVTPLENARIVELLCENVRRRLAGVPLLNVVDTRRYY